MNKIRVIDLLNKIANGEEVPKKIKFNNEIFNFKKDIQNYSTVRDGKNVTLDSYLLIYSINEEVEIIEEEPRDIEVCGSWFTKTEYDELAKEENKKIEKIELDDECIVDYYDGSKHYLNTNRKDRDIYIKKINEIIDYLNSKGK